MGRPSQLNWLVAASILLVGCSSSGFKTDGSNESRAAIERLELRLNQLEQQLNDVKGIVPPTDSKAPAGPIRSLTLRLGTDDDRLRLYWGDGQTSDLACSKEGQGTWACG